MVAHDTGGISRGNLSRRDVGDDHGAGADQASITNRNIGNDDRTNTDKTIRADAAVGGKNATGRNVRSVADPNVVPYVRMIVDDDEITDHRTSPDRIEAVQHGPLAYKSARRNFAARMYERFQASAVRTYFFRQCSSQDNVGDRYQKGVGGQKILIVQQAVVTEDRHIVDTRSFRLEPTQETGNRDANVLAGVEQYTAAVARPEDDDIVVHELSLSEDASVEQYCALIDMLERPAHVEKCNQRE
jgi:hypothetical protein